MELLPCLIPGGLSPEINAVLASDRYKLNNGYDYLWRVLELTIPRFDPVVPIQNLSWSNTDVIFGFAQAYLLHFCLQGKKNFHYNNCTRSGIFLRAIQFSNFANTVTTLQSHVNSFRDKYDDGHLPPHLRLHGLATSIHQNTQAQMRDIISSRVQRLEGSSSIMQGVPTVCRVDWDNRSCVGFKDRGGGGNNGKDYWDHGRNDNPQASQECPHPQRSPGQLARPDCNCCPFLPNVQCAACKCIGHVANTVTCLPRQFASNAI
jgi:hypothetical protein